MHEIAYNIKDKADEMSVSALSKVRDIMWADKNEGKSNNGEVFTPHWCVVNMCNLAKDAIADVTKTVLEPACGSGNILIEVIRRKLASAYRLSNGDKAAFTNTLYTVLQSVYGIDIAIDNVLNCRERLRILVENFWGHAFGETKLPDDVNNTVNDIIRTNIIWGDALENKMWSTYSTDYINKGEVLCLQVFNWKTKEYEFLTEHRPNMLPTMDDMIADANGELDTW